MAEQRERPQIGHRIEAEIIGLNGGCSWGHKVGDKFELSCHDTAGLCGFFYHDIFPSIMMLQFGGDWPWGEKDTIEMECMDRWNVLKIRLRRVGDYRPFVMPAT